ncbi:MAG TPA: hypothetical protein V6C91_20665 [Coleofasciculaceae cyanobacterium]
MVKFCSLRQQPQLISLTKGDHAHYIGLDAKIQLDYGNQDLLILAVDLVNRIAVCENEIGQHLVGVSFRDLQPIY